MAEVTFTSITDVLTAYGERMVTELTDNLEFKGKNATRHLSSSIRYDVRILGTSYVWELYMADYWLWVDQGRKPGKFPPPSAILNWMTAKRVGSFQMGYGKNRSAPGGSITATNYQEQKRLAYLIGRKISRYGTPASHFYSDAFLPGHAGYVPTLENELKEATGMDLQVNVSLVN